MSEADQHDLELVRSEIDRHASSFGLAIDPFIASRLIDYCELLFHWNRRINLIAYSSIPELVSWHLLEALYVTRFLSEGTELIIDVGSGAGIPGVLLGIKLPDCRVQLIESNRRKGIFLEEVARQLNLTNISVFTGRYDHFETTLNAAVTSRALDRMTDEIPRMIEHFRSAEVFLFLLGGTVWRHLKLPSTAQVMGIEKIPLSRERYLVRLRTGRST